MKRREHVKIGYETEQSQSHPHPLKLSVNFNQVCCIPSPGDNCAIATKRIEPNTELLREGEGQTIAIHQTILEGHRFCIVPIRKGDPLLSWGLPFGYALKDVSIGEYVCNRSALDTLSCRQLDFSLPKEANFEDKIIDFHIDHFVNGTSLVHSPTKHTFLGFKRNNRRAGIRNYILILGLTSNEGSFARLLKEEINSSLKLSHYPNIDGIISISHTEGYSYKPNNFQLLMRVLTGWIVHPNIGATLIITSEPPDVDPALHKDYVSEVSIREFMKTHEVPCEDVPHRFYQLSGNLSNDLAVTRGIVESWLPVVNQTSRSECPLSELSIALQCGGSDAFSGVSGNPSAGLAAKELLIRGGSAVLAETDELIGAEGYILRNCRDINVAKRFLEIVNRFKEWTGWHGHTVEANPSGGNKMRGLYNIALKSIGAAMKKAPDVALDYVIEYGERVTKPGYYMMDSPGNDLESIAGQIATGCQIIYFITGNGSITNFPFAPTIKIVTTSSRFQLLKNDMDIDAGQFLTGKPLQEIANEIFALTKEVISGRKTVGEKAGHSQVSIWRNWALTCSCASSLKELQEKAALLPGLSIQPKGNTENSNSAAHFYEAIKTAKGDYVSDQVGLVLPTSLCSSQIAVSIVKKLNDSFFKETNLPKTITKFFALPHTEGCGATPGTAEEIHRRIIVGHLCSPLVKYCVLLEHGCEKTHNDYFSQYLSKELHIDTKNFGWASVQLDGGIEAVTEKVKNLFTQRLANESETTRVKVGMEHLKVAFCASGKLSEETSLLYSSLAQTIINAGGLVVVPVTPTFTQSKAFMTEMLDIVPGQKVKPSLSYGQKPVNKGFHLMETLSDSWVEMISGLGATGVEVMINVSDGNQIFRSILTHPIIPMVRIANPLNSAPTKTISVDEFDIILNNDIQTWSETVLSLVLDIASHKKLPKNHLNDFQISRGPLGIST
eukprot:TRINITY_DN16357_c0_g1_i1.p1 TRINITY_DN16357_c0_g1~~TRINITY_DN16357_c0_g1_i1.p1  ORF type:complete len:950 (-),score=233.99 TRINITY_DN16357_c0_g1_i1:52-2901(-)